MDLKKWQTRRKELKLTYEELAKKAGVSKRTIEDIFRGYTTTPRIDTVEAIEKALGLDNSNDDWTTEERSQGVTNNATVNVNADEFELLELYGNLNKDEKTLIKSFIETMLNKKN